VKVEEPGGREQGRIVTGGRTRPIIGLMDTRREKREEEAQNKKGGRRRGEGEGNRGEKTTCRVKP